MKILVDCSSVVPASSRPPMSTLCNALFSMLSTPS